jgi:hypothetical protein
MAQSTHNYMYHEDPEAEAIAHEFLTYGSSPALVKRANEYRKRKANEKAKAKQGGRRTRRRRTRRRHTRR